MKEKEKIVAQATEIFTKDGFYKTTMDNLAETMRMSKKTIYKFFSSKTDLINTVILTRVKFVSRTFDKIYSEEVNAVIKFCKFSDFLVNIGLKFGNKFFEDLKKMGPDWWQRVDRFRAKILNKNVTRIIEQGKAEGLIIDRPTKLLSHIYISAIRSVINPESIAEMKLSPYEVAEAALEVLFRGLLTSEGLKEFEKYKREKKNEN